MNRLCFFAVIAQGFLSACGPKVPSAEITCASETDCPAGWMCDGICRPSTDETPTQPHTNGTLPDSDTSGSDSSSTSSSTDPGSCELLRQTDANLICCPAEIPKTCAPADWSFSTATDSAKTVGCCSADLAVLVACLDTGEWAPRTCESRCKFVSPRMTCEGPKNNNCDHLIAIDTIPQTWYGRWSDFNNTVMPLNLCGPGLRDALFKVKLPSSGNVVVSSPDPANLRHLESCAVPNCLDWTLSPEGTLRIHGTVGETVVVLVSRSDTADWAFSLRFEP